MDKDRKRNAYRTVFFLCAILLAFTVADFVKKDRFFSENENRILTQKPELSRETLLSGEFAKEYEAYVNDQFISRDTWIYMKTYMDLLLQKRTVNGVYLAADGYLVEQHLPEDYPEELVETRLAKLAELVEQYPRAMVFLAPTADNILTDKLPDFAPYYDQRALLSQVRETIGGEHVINAFDILQQHEDEEIYYHTDHHWTTLGVYYGYLAWAQACDIYPARYKLSRLETVSDDFQGTLHSATGLDAVFDEIQMFAQTAERPVTITYDYMETSYSFYEESYLDTKNQYGYFLDDNHGLVEIETNSAYPRTLFLIKDSYANAMVPLLSAHYQKIYVLDLRYFHGKLFDFMNSMEEAEEMDVLVLYNCIHFLENFNYY